jgi:hypothetical protein
MLIFSKDTGTAKCSVFYVNEKKGIKERQEEKLLGKNIARCKNRSD